jgi:hypothetical protein
MRRARIGPKYWVWRERIKKSFALLYGIVNFARHLFGLRNKIVSPLSTRPVGKFSTGRGGASDRHIRISYRVGTTVIYL